MTAKSHPHHEPEPEPAEPEPTDTSGITTRADLKGQAQDKGTPEAVALTSPEGTKVTVAAELADEMRARGYT